MRPASRNDATQASTSWLARPRWRCAACDEHHRDPAGGGVVRQRRGRRDQRAGPVADAERSAGGDEERPVVGGLVPARRIRQRQPAGDVVETRAARSRARQNSPSRTSNLVGLPKLVPPRRTQSATQSSMRPSGTDRSAEQRRRARSCRTAAPSAPPRRRPSPRVPRRAASCVREPADRDRLGAGDVDRRRRRRAVREAAQHLRVGVALPDDVDVAHRHVDRLAAQAPSRATSKSTP